MSNPRILIIDIETAPNIAHTWGLFKQNVALNQLVRPGYILSFAAKWAGEKDVAFARVKHDATTGAPTFTSRRVMLAKAHALLEEADVVVTYYGSKFDVPRLNAEFMEMGFAPPAPFAQVDLKLAIAKRAMFMSHKLQHVSEQLDIGSKVKHEGHGLWTAVMRDDPVAWQRMERYNIGDVRLTERLYNRVKPWIQGHPNIGLYTSAEKPVCPTCGSKKLQRRGVAYTQAGVYQRLQCACGAWARGRFRDSTTPLRPAVGA